MLIWLWKLAGHWNVNLHTIVIIFVYGKVDTGQASAKSWMMKGRIVSTETKSVLQWSQSCVAKWHDRCCGTCRKFVEEKDHGREATAESTLPPSFPPQLRRIQPHQTRVIQRAHWRPVAQSWAMSAILLGWKWSIDSKIVRPLRMYHNSAHARYITRKRIGHLCTMRTIRDCDVARKS